MFAFIIKTKHSIIVHILQTKRQLEWDVGKFEPNGATATWSVHEDKVVIVEVRASYLQLQFVNPTMTGYNLYVLTYAIYEFEAENLPNGVCTHQSHCLLLCYWISCHGLLVSSE